MISMEDVICPNCKSTHIKKCGFNNTISGKKQAYWCYDCLRRFITEYRYKDGVIKEEEHHVAEGIRKTYPQDWPVYNESQTREKLMFLDILADLCSYIPEEERKIGRPRANLQDMVFCGVTKCYEHLSSRRLISDIEIARQRGYVTHTPHFNTTLKYLNQPFLTPVLTDLIKLSALPLKDFEQVFAVDASGLSSAFYSRWLDYRFNGDKRVKDWIKIHLMCGIKSSIVTHIIVTDGHRSDSPIFPELVRETAKNFRIAEVSADKAYSSRDNVQVVSDIGAVPYIPFKVGATGRCRGSYAWNKLFHYFQFHKEEFMQHYHQRSNVESTFSSLKRKFQGKLMLKNEDAQVNEALAKVLCHNICILIGEVLEGNAEMKFAELAHIFPSLHINSVKELRKV